MLKTHVNYTFDPDAKSPLTEEQMRTGFVVSQDINDAFHILNPDVLGVRVLFNSRASDSAFGVSRKDLSRLIEINRDEDLLEKEFPMVAERRRFISAMCDVLSSDYRVSPFSTYYAGDEVLESSVPCWHQDASFWTILSSVYGPGIHYIQRKIDSVEEATELYSTDNNGIEGMVRSMVGDIVLIKGKSSFDDDIKFHGLPVFHKGAQEDRFAFVFARG